MRRNASSTFVVADAILEMPPVPMWFRGRDHDRGFMAEWSSHVAAGTAAADPTYHR